MSWAHLEVEVVLLHVDNFGLGYRIIRGVVPDGEHPDLSVLLVVGCAAIRVSHSTSWRYEDGGTIVLTYAVLPDPDPRAPRTTLLTPSVVCSGDATRPTPALLHAHHIAAHAVRHLAYLRQHDPAIAAASYADPELWDAIADTAERTPTGTHARVHQSFVDELPAAIA